MVAAGPNPKISFGKPLTHVDVKVRDQALDELSEWIVDKNLDDLEVQKIWKGLSYNMWMSDTRPVQQALAVKLTMLMNKLSDEMCLRWLKAFFTLFQAEYQRLDRHRIDKYLLLLRITMAEIFENMRRRDWDLEYIKPIVCVWEETIMKVLSPNQVKAPGASLQFMRVFWDELKVSAKSGPFTAATFDELMRLFFNVVHHGKQIACCNRAHEVIEACPLGRQLIIRKLTALVADPAVNQVNRERLQDSLKVLERLQAQIPQDELPGEALIATPVAEPKAEEEKSTKKPKWEKISYRKQLRLEAEEKKEKQKISPEMRQQVKFNILKEIMQEQENQVSVNEEVKEAEPTPEGPKKLSKRQKKLLKKQEESSNSTEAAAENESADNATEAKPEEVCEKKEEAPAEESAPSSASTKKRKISGDDSLEKIFGDVSKMTKNKKRKMVEKLLMKLAIEDAMQEEAATQPKKKEKKSKDSKESSQAPTTPEKKKVKAKSPEKITEKISAKKPESEQKQKRVSFNISQNKVIRFKKNQVVSKSPLKESKKVIKPLLKRQSTK